MLRVLVGRRVHSTKCPECPPPHLHLAICLVGMGEIDKAKAAFAAGQRLAPEYFRIRLEGTSRSPGRRIATPADVPAHRRRPRRPERGRGAAMSRCQRARAGRPWLADHIGCKLPLTGAAHGPMEFPSLSPRIVEGPSRLSNDTAMRPTNMSGLGTFCDMARDKDQVRLSHGSGLPYVGPSRARLWVQGLVLRHTARSVSPRFVKPRTRRKARRSPGRVESPSDRRAPRSRCHCKAHVMRF